MPGHQAAAACAPQPEMCGANRLEALAQLGALERGTSTSGAAVGKTMC